MFNPFKKSYSNSELSLFRLLKKTKVFEQLNFRQLSLFIPSLFLRTYTRNEVIFFRNDPSHALYILKSGSVQLTIDIKGKFEPLTEIGKGSAFGDNALLKKTTRIYTAVVTSEEAELYILPQVNIHEVFESHEEIKAQMMESFAEWYNQYHKNLFSAYKSSFGFFNLGEAYVKTRDL